MPAGLVKLLLLMAGIESNPGPYICPVCHVMLRSNTRSCQCTRCFKWLHHRKQNNCSGLTSLKDYTKFYVCPDCLNDPLPDPPPLINPQPHPADQPPPPVVRPPPPATQHPPPVQHNNYNNNNNSREYDLKIMQWNCNGIKSKLPELTDFIYQHQIKVAVIQETKLSDKSTSPDIPNFTLVRKDRASDSGGGLAIFIHKSIQFLKLPDLPTDGHTESLGVLLGDTNIYNIYIPPTSSCTTGFKPNFNTLLPDGDSLVLGDVNAHDSLWHSSIQDSRGSDLAEEIGNSPYGVLNENSPTRVPSNGPKTSPDISLASTSLIPSTEWNTITSLGSDHLPIIIKIGTNVQPIKSDFRNFINFNKADWSKYYDITEAEFLKLSDPTCVHSAEVKFRQIINKAASKTIPGGRIKDVIPEMPTATAAKIKERDELRSTNPDSPELATLNVTIMNETREHRSTKWREKVCAVNKNCSSDLHKLIKNLNGKSGSDANQAIKFKGRYITSAYDIAKAFNKKFSSVVPHKSSPSSRNIAKDVKKNSLEDPVSFTFDQTKKAIMSCKSSKAAGPDNITNLHLKHLGPNGIMYLTKIFNMSIKTSTIPDIWKRSIIVPLLKPNKPSNEADSYRPVSLLCPPIKILERLLLPTLTEKLDIPIFQHGFRQNHSTVTALNDFNQQVTNGFNEKSSTKPDRTVLLQIDLSKAFDMVSHDKLIKDLDQSDLPPSLIRWFSTYLRGRQSTVSFRNELSSCRNVRAGVPQGAVTSPILFNFYLRNLPTPPDNVQVVQYADDISIYATGKPISGLTNAINYYIPSVIEFLEERELQVSPSKSTVTLFTPDTREAKIHPQVKMDRNIVPHEPNPKLLGVTFDTMYTFSKHVNITANKAKSKVNIMKHLAGSTWGQDLETLTLTYKSICRSVMEYAAPIWSPIISKASWTKLQTVQNQALRVITGNLKMASEQHLHREAKILPIRDHCDMISKQFLLSNYTPNHPGLKHTNRPLPARKMKPTIHHLRDDIQYLLPVTRNTLKSKYKTIHTSEVAKALDKYPPNKVLGTNPPEVSAEESSLSRITRSRLSQLRSGFSRLLNSYLHRINNDTADTCPQCNVSPHNTRHLFNCLARPTNLQVQDLWTQPALAANYLNLDDGVT